MIQLVDRNEPSLIRSLKPESTISVNGIIENGTNGDTDISVNSVQVLNESGIIGAHLTAGTKDWPPEYRYIQLRQPLFQQTLRTRAKIMRICRNVLDSLQFTEIETPLLFKSTPEGANEFLVPTRKKGFMYALPQSPQQYKQLLMASGVHGYYQIAKCFRDEDLRADRQPEFTQLDLEMSFANGDDIRRVVEKVAKDVWRGILDKPLYTLTSDGKYLQECSKPSQNFQQLSYSDAISRFGIDKPDLRSNLEITDLSDSSIALENDDYPVLEALIIRSDGSNPFTKEDLQFISDQNSYKCRLPKIKVIEQTDNLQTEIEELISTNNFAKITNHASFFNQLAPLNTGDIIAFSTRQKQSYENPTPLGRFRQLAIERFPNRHLRTKPDGSAIISKDDFVATWVTDFPLFNPIEDTTTTSSTTAANEYPEFNYNSLVSTHHPFTMVHMDDYEQLATAPLQTRGQHYDLVINGVEVGGGSTRIHDTTLQRYIFEKLLKIKNSQVLFGHLLEAFAAGTPPHAGLAIGMDRLVAMLCKTTSIRDVIAFPKTITGADPLIGSPSKTTTDQLAPYHVRTA